MRKRIQPSATSTGTGTGTKDDGNHAPSLLLEERQLLDPISCNYDVQTTVYLEVLINSTSTSSSSYHALAPVSWDLTNVNTGEIVAQAKQFIMTSNGQYTQTVCVDTSDCLELTIEHATADLSFNVYFGSPSVLLVFRSSNLPTSDSFYHRELLGDSCPSSSRYLSSPSIPASQSPSSVPYFHPKGFNELYGQYIILGFGLLALFVAIVKNVMTCMRQ